ncbi:DUF1146 family protein [Levilactobacillus bambusae]|uniref:DUF1146 domain-containing protein n=1 Tax=Levilactobacillus bambusae TaxID=2024736 RepID=A0A2V1MWS3_9LACO|nr:DUF1146 family protein [Levilactobacillus bambusae]PWF99530.1 hypothetical protein DCM90_08795 [Levilactobacillus bambusae]
MRTIGLEAILTLCSHLGFILIAFWAIQGLHLERYMKFYPRQAKILIVFLSVALGFTVSSFFLSFIDNVRNLGYLLK